MPGTYIGIWEAFSQNNIPILAMRTPWLVRNGRPFFPADCLADGGDAISCGIKRSDVLSDHNPTLDFVGRFPLLKPLDMSDAVCRKDFCRAVEGNVLLYHDSHHLSTTYMTMPGSAVRSARPLVIGVSSTERVSVPTIWPGTPTRWAPPTTVRGPTFRCSPRSPKRSSCACRQGRHRGTDQPRRGRRIRLARLPADRDPGSALRLRVHGPWDPAAGHRCDRASCCSIRTASRSTATSTSARRCSPTTWRRQ